MAFLNYSPAAGKKYTFGSPLGVHRNCRCENPGSIVPVLASRGRESPVDGAQGVQTLGNVHGRFGPPALARRCARPSGPLAGKWHIRLLQILGLLTLARFALSATIGEQNPNLRFEHNSIVSTSIYKKFEFCQDRF